MRDDEGTRVALKFPDRPEVPDGYEGTTLTLVKVLASNSDVELSLYRLR
jgi:hypothetical protein